ncbi:hypothetical protein POM88_034280 [Heracleum sosnowskyi]|uniref:Uncharacterized protein n=1 Tax=Heracleum sosnowskyi TaxID=360622 RepID=A0AAD8HKZ1_9APIA|nr:hypothetical protein POM88_034280 [Heracleum sosnowskyi]
MRLCHRLVLCMQHADVVPLRVGGDCEPIAKKPLCVPIAGHGLASKGNKVQLLSNHIKVIMTNVDGNFFTTIMSSSMKTVVQLSTHFQQFERPYSYKRKYLANRVYASDEARAAATYKAGELEISLGADYPTFVKPMLQSHVTGRFWLTFIIAVWNEHGRPAVEMTSQKLQNTIAIFQSAYTMDTYAVMDSSFFKIACIAAEKKNRYTLELMVLVTQMQDACIEVFSSLCFIYITILWTTYV